MASEVLIVAIILAVAIFTIYAWRAENKEWNGGICRETGKAWELVYVDNDGGRKYSSENYDIHITYPYID